MLYLVLAILCSASLALIFRYTESRRYDRRAITAANYLAAAVASLIVSLLRHGPTLGLDRPAHFWAEAGAVLGGAAQFSPAAAPWWGVCVGLPSGALFYGAFMLYQASIRENGPALSGMFGKLGILVPTAGSLLLFHTPLLPRQWAGMLLALGAMALSQLPRLLARQQTSRPSGRRLLLVLMMLSMGLAEFSNKIFQGLAGQQHRGVFLLVTFSSALLVAAVALARRKELPRRRDLLLGLAVGLPNLFSSYFLIMALPTVTAAVAFPAYSAGSMVLIALGARAIYGDRLGHLEWAAVGLTAVGLVLIG